MFRTARLPPEIAASVGEHYFSFASISRRQYKSCKSAVPFSREGWADERKGTAS